MFMIAVITELRVASQRLESKLFVDEHHTSLHRCCDALVAAVSRVMTDLDVTVASTAHGDVTRNALEEVDLQTRTEASFERERLAQSRAAALSSQVSCPCTLAIRVQLQQYCCSLHNPDFCNCTCRCPCAGSS